MTSVLNPGASATPRPTRKRRGWLDAVLRGLLPQPVEPIEVFLARIKATEAALLSSTERDDRLAGELEVERLHQRVSLAMAAADRVSVRVDVVGGSGVYPDQLAAIRELCQTAPAVIAFLLERGREGRPDNEDLVDELRELQSRGLVAFERGAGGELRCRVVEDTGDAR